MGRSTVIKAGAAPDPCYREPARFALRDIMAEAKAALDAARAEAARIIADARHEAEAALASAREEGYRQGYEEGLREGRTAGASDALASASQTFAEQQRSLVSALEQALTQINEKRAIWETAARQDLIDLAMAIARRVARQVGRHDRQVILANLEEAIGLVGTRSEVTILVNPIDAEAARQFTTLLTGREERWQRVGITETTEVSPGGCRIRWGSGEVDARLETQLDRIESELGSGRAPGEGPGGSEART